MSSFQSSGCSAMNSSIGAGIPRMQVDELTPASSSRSSGPRKVVLSPIKTRGCRRAGSRPCTCRTGTASSPSWRGDTQKQAGGRVLERVRLAVADCTLQLHATVAADREPCPSTTSAAPTSTGPRRGRSRLLERGLEELLVAHLSPFTRVGRASGTPPGRRRAARERRARITTTYGSASSSSNGTR